MADEDKIDPRAAMLERAWATPDARPLLEKALKIALPHANIPSLELREATEKVEASLKEREAAIDAKFHQMEIKREHERAISDLKNRGFNDGDVKEIEKIMAEEGVGTHANAATLYEFRRQVAAPRTPSTEPRGSMSPKAYQRGAHAPYFHGIMEGEFKYPGEDWARSKADMILEDFKSNPAEAEKKWSDAAYWPADPNFPVQKA